VSNLETNNPYLATAGTAEVRGAPSLRWGAVTLCYLACVGSAASVWIAFAVMWNWQAAAEWGLGFVAVFDLLAVIAAVRILRHASQLQRLVAYPGIYLSFYLTVTHAVAWWI
jgi:hypothetical protein